jgi:hypothetical protein
MCATCHAHLTLLYLIILIIFLVCTLLYITIQYYYTIISTTNL